MIMPLTANNPPIITGPQRLMVTLNQEIEVTINVTDTNLVSFNITNGVLPGSSLIRDPDDVSIYTFTWTPAQFMENRTIVFTAVDDMNANTVYEPIIEICSCLNGGTCTSEGLLNQMANPLTLNCICLDGMYVCMYVCML